MTFEYLQEGRLHNLSGNPVPVVHHLHSKVVHNVYTKPSLLQAEQIHLSQFFFSEERCSSPTVIFMALHWTLSSSSKSLLYWGAQDWTRYSTWESGSGRSLASHRQGHSTSQGLGLNAVKCSPEQSRGEPRWGPQGCFQQADSGHRAQRWELAVVARAIACL